VIELDDKQFEQIVSDAIENIPGPYQEHLQNVAFIIEDEPTQAQRQQLKLYPNETLFGLYEGVPLPARQGTTKLLPDKITIFKKPALAFSGSIEELRGHVRHTVWHEVAHYYGLDHAMIHKLENKKYHQHKLV
jgi:predicted Zn-dependent protease with MMP-like domain